MRRTMSCALAAGFLAAASAWAQPQEDVLAQVRAQKQPFLDTLKELTGIESGSRDPEGLEKIAQAIAARLKAVGGEVELVEPAEIYRMEDTPEKIGRAVRATFKGRGTKKVLLLAHMDTVYLPGMGEQQPFRVDGDKAYGLGIADDKQGVAMIVHVLALLKSLNSTAGILLHYPALQVERTVSGTVALVEGRTENPLALIGGAPRR